MTRLCTGVLVTALISAGCAAEGGGDVASSTAMKEQAVKANLIVNGDFESGNTGFASDYGYASAPNSGQYTISTNANATYSAWPAQYGSGCAGKFLIGNASSDTSLCVWKQTVQGLRVGANVRFSFVATSLYGTAPSNLQLYVDGVAVPGCSLQTAFDGENTCDWQTKTCDVNGISGAPTFCLKDTVGAYIGDDFALDAIQAVCRTSCACTPGETQSCGTCMQQTCSADGNGWGVCAAIGNCCIPRCQNKQCGADGCGGSCGGCMHGYACTNGVCGTCGDGICDPVEADGACPEDCGGQPPGCSPELMPSCPWQGTEPCCVNDQWSCCTT